LVQIVKKPLIKSTHIEKEVSHECDLKVLGIIETVINCIFQARQKRKEYSSVSSSIDDTNFIVEAAIITEPQTFQSSSCVEENMSDTVQTGSETQKSVTTNKSLQLSEKSLELLRSLQSQNTLPGMGLHRDNRTNNVISLSPKHTVNMFLDTTVDKVPRLNLSKTQNDRNKENPKQCLSVRSCHSARTFRTATTPTSLMKRCGTDLPEGTPRNVQMTSLLNNLKPPFKIYSCANDLISDYKEKLNNTTNNLPQKYSLVIFQIKCKVFSTPLK
jgi:hypothetical protein